MEGSLTHCLYGMPLRLRYQTILFHGKYFILYTREREKVRDCRPSGIWRERIMK